jgi:hypothetical protein
MRGEAMVMAVRLTTIYPTQKKSMCLITGISTMKGAEMGVILHNILLHDHQRIPNPAMKVRNKSLDKSTDSVPQCTVLSTKFVLRCTT